VSKKGRRHDRQRYILLLCFCAVAAHAQEIRIYSEFERFNPFGSPVAQDRDMTPREILSPAMARNGHLSVHVVVSAPAGTNYFLYAATNPPDILQVRIYREYFTRCGNDYCPEWLTEQNSPSFGAIPELVHDLSRPAMNNQTTRCYLFDILATADTPPRRVRVEALLKTGTWYVAPMEVRIVSPMVPRNDSPSAARGVVEEDLAPIEAPSSATAQIQLYRYFAGLPPEWPAQLLRVRDIIQRNAAEDMLLARSLDHRPGAGSPGRAFPELNLLSWWPLAFPGVGAEWYLKVRDFLYRFDP
jgi:hypothetical protein